MSFRERMKVARSAAEQRIHIELERRGLTKFLYPLESVIMLDKASPNRGCIISKEKLTRDMVPTGRQERPKFTVPDFIIKTELGSRAATPVYIDGPPHEKRGSRNRDAKINNELTLLGFPYLRFSYRGQMSKQRLTEICDKMEALCKEVTL